MSAPVAQQGERRVYDTPPPSDGGHRDEDGRWHWDRPDGTPDGTVVRCRPSSGSLFAGSVGVITDWDSRGGCFTVAFRVRADGSPHSIYVKPPTPQHLLDAGVRLVGVGTLRRDQLQRAS